MLTETLIIPDITKTSSNNCFIIHYFKENNDKRTVQEANRQALFLKCFYFAANKMPLTTHELLFRESYVPFFVLIM